MSRLWQVQASLLSLHRAVLEAERLAFEREHGRLSAAGFLQALVNHPQLAWLSPLTAIVVEVEQALEAEEEDEADAPGPERQQLARVRELLRPDPEAGAFQSRYAELVQRSPDVVLAHGALSRALA